MKSILIIACLFIATNSLAAERALELKIKDGQPNFGIQYAYDVDSVFNFSYATTISNETLATLPNSLVWNILNLSNNTLLTEWNPLTKMELQFTNLEVTGPSAIAVLLPNLKTSKVVFGARNQNGGVDTLFSIPIGPLCANYQSHFMDLSHPSKAACTVTAQDIPEPKNKCKELEDTLLGYLKRGLLNCQIAKAQFEKRGCGVLACD